MLTQKEKIPKILFYFYFADFFFSPGFHLRCLLCFSFYSGGLTFLTLLVFNAITDSHVVEIYSEEKK